MQFIGQLARQPFTEFLGRLAETGPDVFADIGLSQIAKDRTGIVDLVRERHAEDILICGGEVRDIRLLPLLPVRLSFAFGCVSKAVQARRHHSGHAIAEPVANVLQPGFAALILYAVMKKRSVAAALSKARTPP
jgi:hypothetical protein